MQTTLTAVVFSLFSTAHIASLTAHAAPEPRMPSQYVPWPLDTGFITAPPAKHTDYTVIFRADFTVDGSPWLRINFDHVELAGIIEEGTASYLRITSLSDGAVQLLNAESLRHWANRTAFMNGDAVKIELLARPATGPSRIVIRSLTAGLPEEADHADSICDGVDLRELSSDPRVGRPIPTRCSAWLFNDTNRTFLSAGHCQFVAGDAIEFNVPLSMPNGTPVVGHPDDQYPIDITSLQRQSGNWTVGHDWAYIGCFPNSTTGLTPIQAQGEFYTLAPAAPPVAGQMIRITGYGSVTSPISPTWNRVLKTHAGPYSSMAGNIIRYRADTTGGNSGSAVQDESTGTVIGIHTHGGCSGSGGSNQGTNIAHPEVQMALADPKGVCRSGWGNPAISEPPLYAIGDVINNFGTLSLSTGLFATIAPTPPRMEGLAYNPAADIFYAVSFIMYTQERILYSINPADGAATSLAAISGTSEPINGLGFDAINHILYGIAQASGQLYSIDVGSGHASPIGAAGGGTMAALEWDPLSRMLYAIDDAPPSSRLIMIHPGDGHRNIIGALAQGATGFRGLGITEDGRLFAVHSGTGQLAEVDRSTGRATPVGQTHGLWNASFGLAAVISPPCYANCDGSTTPPILNVDDFTCFINEFAAATHLPHEHQLTHYANCDQSTSAPVLNVDDFTCFINAFAAGCP